MSLARVSGSLTKPWSLATREFNAVLGEPAREGDRWRWTARFRLSELELAADRATGDVDVTVTTPLPYSVLAVASAVVASLVAIRFGETAAALAALTICLPTALAALLPGIYQYQWLYDRLPDAFEAETIRVTPFVLLPLGGVVFGLWRSATSVVVHALTLLLTAFLLVLAGYAVGFTPESLRRQFPVFAFAFFSGFPLLLAVGNIAIVASFADWLPAPQVALLVSTLAGFTALTLVAYAFLCRAFLRGMSDVPNRPVTSRSARIAWFGYLLSLNALFLVAFVAPLTDVWRFDAVTLPAGAVAAGFDAVGVPFAGVVAFGALSVLAVPLLAVLCYWGYHVSSELRSRRALVAATSRVDREMADYPLRILDTDRPVAHATASMLGRAEIVLSEGLIGVLDGDELAAVVAHEEFHARNGDTRWVRLGSFFGALVGGRNALVAAYDYPAVERAADRYAADRHGAAPLVSALRTIERQRGPARTPGPQFARTRTTERVPWVISAPYRVLFAGALIAHAHAGVDERVAAVYAQRETGD